MFTSVWRGNRDGGNRQPLVLARKEGSFSEVPHLTAAAFARYRRGSQASAKTYLLLDATEAESERTTTHTHTHNGDAHTLRML